MPRYEWRGSDVFRDNRNDREIARGDIVELDESVAEPHSEFVRVEEGDDEAGDEDLPFDPNDATVSELRDLVNDAPDALTDETAEALYQAEADGKDRDTALEILDRLR